MSKATDVTTLSAREARAVIDGVRDAAGLETIEAQERAHPQFPGGRRSVVAYVAARRAVLVGAAAAPEPEEEREPAVLASSEPWGEGSWSGLQQFTCAHCRFQTLERADMERHAAEAHGFAIAAPAAAAPAPAEAQSGALWTEAQWAGHRQFTCRVCGRYQTLDRLDLDHHLATAHPIEWRRHLKTRAAQ